MDTSFEFGKVEERVFRLLCRKAGGWFSQRTLAGMVGVSPTAVGAAVKRLEKERLAAVRRRGKMKLSEVGFNRDSRRAFALKRVENLRQVYESGLADFLFESFPGCRKILFGSYSRGEDTIKSDIDIAVLDSRAKRLDLGKFEKQLERPVNVQAYENIGTVDPNLKSNILEGITL